MRPTHVVCEGVCMIDRYPRFLLQYPQHMSVYFGGDNLISGKYVVFFLNDLRYRRERLKSNMWL